MALGKKKKDNVNKKHKIQELKTKGLKSKCCEKYKKRESKRCKKCPCFDLIKEKAA